MPADDTNRQLLKRASSRLEHDIRCSEPPQLNYSEWVVLLESLSLGTDRPRVVAHDEAYTLGRRECEIMAQQLIRYFADKRQKTDRVIIRLRAFVDWVLDEMKDGGDLDGGAFQDNAQRLGILVETRPTEPCSDTCVCAEYYSAEEFTQGEAKCFVRSTLVGGKVPPPPFTCPTCQGGGLAITTDQGAGCPACGKVG